MLTIQHIYERHPELLELREFKTNEEIVEAFRNGGTMWHVWSSIYGDGGVSSFPKEVISIGVYEGKCEELQGKSLYHYRFTFEGKIISSTGFITDLQNVPAKGVFTTKERAEVFFKAVKQAFENDPDWQADQRALKAEVNVVDRIFDDEDEPISDEWQENFSSSF